MAGNTIQAKYDELHEIAQIVMREQENFAKWHTSAYADARNQLANGWKGEAAAKFWSKEGDLDDAIGKLITALQTCHSQIQSIVSTLEDADQTAASHLRNYAD